MKKCLKCGHYWDAVVDAPKRCPRCFSYCWNRPKNSPGRSPEFCFNIKRGFQKLFPWSKDKEKNHRLNKALYIAQKKNPRLVVTARHDGLMVTNA